MKARLMKGPHLTFSLHTFCDDHQPHGIGGHAIMNAVYLFSEIKEIYVRWDHRTSDDHYERT